MLLDDDLEDLKIKLVGDKDFYPSLVFRHHLDKDNKGYVTSHELLNFLDGSHLTIDEVLQMLKDHNTSESNEESEVLKY